MTGFNKTLDMNLEHAGTEYTHNQSINHQQFFFRKEEIQKVSSPMIRVATLCFPCSHPYVPRCPQNLIPRPFYDSEEKIRAYVATLRRRDVAVSQC